MKVLNKFKSRVILAPLAGITDHYFRTLALEYGAGLVTIPMINANAIVRKNKATMDLLTTTKDEQPKAVQLFGTKSNIIKQAAKIAVEKTGADILDFNMGCPQQNIIRQGAGAALLKRPKKIQEIVETLRSAVDVPISIKIRIGGSQKSINVFKNAQIIEDAGADLLTVHGRTVEQVYSGKADWEIIRQVKEQIKIPLVANGDVWDEESAENLFNTTKADAIMIGRGALGKPYIFEKINYYLKNKKPIDKHYNQLEIFKKYLDGAKGNKPFAKIKQHALYFTKGMDNSTKLRSDLSMAKDVVELEYLMDSLTKSI